MSLVFYTGSGSPFAWRVHLALEHKGLTYETKLLSFSRGDPRAPQFRALNPRGRVPVVVDDGFALFESAAILEYLDERFPTGARLLPGTLRDRARVRRLIREVDSYLSTPESDLTRELFSRASTEERDADRVERARQLWREELTYFEAELHGEWFGPEVSAADFTLYPFLALLPRYQRKADLGLTAFVGPRLQAWMRRVEALPYFDVTYPPHWRK